jgi:hypothetical protein
LLQGFRGGLDSPYVKVETSTKMVSTSTTAGHEYEHSTAQRSTARVNKGRRTEEDCSWKEEVDDWQESWDTPWEGRLWFNTWRLDYSHYGLASYLSCACARAGARLERMMDKDKD